MPDDGKTLPAPGPSNTGTVPADGGTTTGTNVPNQSYGINLVWAAASTTPWTADQKVVATAIAMAESGGDPNAINMGSAKYPEHSVGLWQINLDAHPQYTEADMFNPAKNAAAAFEVSGGGSTWTPWSVFKNYDTDENGAQLNTKIYEKYLPDAMSLANVEGAGLSIGDFNFDSWKSGAGSIASSIPGVGAIKSVGDFLGWITTASNVRRVLMVVMGIIGMTLGVLIMSKGSIGSAVRTVRGG